MYVQNGKSYRIANTINREKNIDCGIMIESEFFKMTSNLPHLKVYEVLLIESLIMMLMGSGHLSFFSNMLDLVLDMK